ncbi:MAG: adenylate/guanylate cyclase domain-containing protein [Gammaproteobacteria bacterium]|nr:adenylate/guanylate cyclase domain-containing protein [Gammaproteobacteria bacterium]
MLVDLTFSAFYIVISGNATSVPETLALSVFFLLLVNISVGLWLFRHIRGQEAVILTSEAELSRQIRRLPLKNAAWVFCLMLVYKLVSVSLGNYVLDSAAPTQDMLPTLYIAALWFSLLYAFQFSLFAYFIGIAVSIHTRSWFYHSHNLEIHCGPGLLSLRLLMGMVAIILIPSALILTDVWFFKDIRVLQGLTTKQAVLLDVLSMLVAAAVSVLFTWRSFTIPLQNIRDAMEQTSSGSNTARAPVLTDDEIGVVADSFNNMMGKINERKFIVETFGRYVPESVAADIIRNKGEYKPQYRLATILYTDIAGFTSLCERLPPEEIASLLNEYFALLTAIINKHGGIVNQFQGDAMLVTYNVPARDDNHADNALLTAVEIQQTLAEHVFRNGYRMPTRIGINTGKVFAGTVGGKERLNYTVHGDAVNVAARLEHLNKEYDSSILISKATRLELSDSIRERVDLVPMGKLKVRGKSNEIRVYQASSAASASWPTKIAV